MFKGKEVWDLRTLKRLPSPPHLPYPKKEMKSKIKNDVTKNNSYKLPQTSVQEVSLFSEP